MNNKAKVKSLGANQTEISKQNVVTVFVSYQTPVAAMVPGRGHIKTECRWSKTTTRHINKWLNGLNAVEVPQSELDALL